MRIVAMSLVAVVLVACGGASSGTDGGTGGGSAGGSATGGGSGGSGGGSAVVQPMTCTPGGSATALAEITGRGVELTYSTSAFVAPGSDLTGAVTEGNSIRLGLTPSAANNPPHTELSVFVNGCSVGKLNDVGEEYFWTTRPGDPAVSVEGGKHLVIEVVRAGQGVILRKSYALPAVLPQLASPAANAAITAPLVVQWAPIVATGNAELRITAWKSTGTGSGSTDGSLKIPDPSAGTITWNAGSASWTSLQLQLTLEPAPAITFYVSHYRPVN